MIIRWVINISSRSLKVEWASLTHSTTHSAKKIRTVNKRTNYILYTLPTEYNKQASTHASRIFHHMCSMQVSHYRDVIMRAMASQITSLTIVYSTFYSVADQRKHQSSASLAFVRGIHRSPVNSPHKGPGTRQMFPFGDVIMHICMMLMMRRSDMHKAEHDHQVPCLWQTMADHRLRTIRGKKSATQESIWMITTAGPGISPDYPS